MLGFHALGEAPLGALVQAAATVVAVYAEFPASYAILRDVPYVPSEVYAEFPASYKIISSIIMAYTPSKARTLKVKATGLAYEKPTGDSFWNLNNAKLPSCLKDPNETIDISLDWNEILIDIGDTLASHTIVVDPKLSNAGSAIKDGVTTVFLSGGGTVAGKLNVTFRVTTASAPARVFDRTVQIVIEER